MRKFARDPPNSIANAPEFIEGAINLGASLHRSWILGSNLALKSLKYDELTVVCVVNVGKRVVGVVVDSVSDLLALNSRQINPVSELSAAADVGFIRGTCSAPGDAHERMLILVDIDDLISR